MTSSSKKRLNFNPYEVLGLERGCKENEIDKAYKRKALKWHPDKNPDKKEKAQAMFIQIYEAYEFLKDSASRSEYDEAELSNQRKFQYEQERRYTASATRKEFIDKLRAREQAFKEEQLKATQRMPQKKTRKEKFAEEEFRRKRDSSIERLGREAAEMLERKLLQEREDEEKRKKEEEKFNGFNLNMTAEEFAKFEEDVLNGVL